MHKEIFFRFSEPRDQQKQLVEDIWLALNEGKNLVAHAPTGLGKTDSALSPAISYALKNNKTVFFLTPKISQHEIAVQVVRGLKEKFKLNLKAVDFVGKKYMCIDPFIETAEGSSFYELCAKKRLREACTPYGNARGYSKEQKDKSKIYLEILNESNSSVLSHHEIKEISKEFAFAGEHRPLCPYEVATILASKANIVIGDYFHLLSPTVQDIVLKRINKKLEDCIIIVDEAHNLPDRVRSLMSSSLSTFHLRKASDELDKLNQQEFREKIKKIEKKLRELAMQKLSEKNNEVLISKEKFNEILKEVSDQIEDFALELRELGSEFLEGSGKTKSSLISISNFLIKWEEESEARVRILQRNKSRDEVSIQLRALDPSLITKNIFSKVHSVILMSGTLLPTKMYADLLGLQEEKTELKEYSSPFPKHNKLNLIDPSVTTKFTERKTEEFQKIGMQIIKIVNEVPGNSAVFFPSYKILESVYPFIQDKISRQIFKQKEKMNSNEAASMLQSFRNAGHGFGGTLLGVLGGSFSEGVDYLGNALKGVVIVGVPLQEMNLELKSLIDYYEEKFGRGWHYAYIYPAMNKAMQAAGRCIRDISDEGIITFMDKRYLWQNYSSCFPKDFSKTVTVEPEKFVKLFFSN